MVDLATIALALSAIASIAVVVTALLVVFQLRQNTRLIEHAAREYRANVALAILEKFTDVSFPRRRKAMHDASKLFTEQGASAFDDTPEDLEARNFGFIYQIVGTLVRAGVVDEDLVVRSLGRLVVADWEWFAPIAEHLKSRYHQRIGAWEEFQWLAGRIREHFDRLEGRR